MSHARKSTVPEGCVNEQVCFFKRSRFSHPIETRRRHDLSVEHRMNQDLFARRTIASLEMSKRETAAWDLLV